MRPVGINNLLPGTPYMATTFQPDAPRTTTVVSDAAADGTVGRT